MTNKELPTMTARQVARFWQRVVKKDGCWTWVGPAKVMVNGDYYKPARLAYALTKGEPIGCVIRLCDTPNCVCPDHLKLASEYEAGIRGYVGSILKIRHTSRTSAAIAINIDKPIELIDAIRRGKIL